MLAAKTFNEKCLSLSVNQVKFKVKVKDCHNDNR